MKVRPLVLDVLSVERVCPNVGDMKPTSGKSYTAICELGSSDSTDRAIDEASPPVYYFIWSVFFGSSDFKHIEKLSYFIISVVILKSGRSHQGCIRIAPSLEVSIKSRSCLSGPKSNGSLEILVGC